MKIKTSKANRKGLSVHLAPGVMVNFNQDGIGVLEAEDRLEEILKRDPSISVVGEPKKVESNKPTPPPVETNVEPKKVEEITQEEDSTEDKQETEDTTSEDIESLRSQMNSLKVVELQELCIEGEYLDSEWKELKKKDLIEYIINKQS